MELRLPAPKELRLAYIRDLRSSFPPEEMRTLGEIRTLTADGFYRPYCLFDGDEIIGEAFLLLARPGWALLDYLCVAAAHRSRRLGPELVRLLLEAEPEGTVIFGEAEAPEYAPDPPLAKRRIEHFYYRSGWRDAGYDSELYGAHYRCIYLANRVVEREELLKQHQHLYHMIWTPKQLRRNIRVPWDPSYQTPKN